MYASCPSGIAGGALPAEVETEIENIALSGATPLVVANNKNVLGTVHLKDIVKGGLPDRFERFRSMGIRTIMITCDTSHCYDLLKKREWRLSGRGKTEDKLALIRREQSAGHLVAMTGDGTNDAPALAQADVGVAMNTGTQAAKEAGNMVDLDSNPTKLIEVVEIGKQLLMTRGALTTFSVANDVARFCDHPCDAGGNISADSGTERNGTLVPAKRHLECGNFQCANNCGTYPPGSQRDQIPAFGSGGHFAKKSAYIRAGGHHCSLHRN